MRKILLLLLVAPTLDAATQYRVTIQTTGNPQQKAPIAATVLVDGAQRRVSVGNNLTMLSTDGGSTVIDAEPSPMLESPASASSNCARRRRATSA